MKSENDSHFYYRLLLFYYANDIQLKNNSDNADFDGEESEPRAPRRRNSAKRHSTCAEKVFFANFRDTDGAGPSACYSTPRDRDTICIHVNSHNDEKNSSLLISECTKRRIERLWTKKV